MDWQIRPPGGQSSISERAFAEGDRILCILHVNDLGEILRSDIFADEESQFETEGSILGKWSHVVKDTTDEEREAQQQTLSTCEELFLSLYVDETEPSRERDILKQLLALMLECKRILKARDKPVDGLQSYMHMPTRLLYDVPIHKLGPEEIAAIDSQLQNVLA